MGDQSNKNGYEVDKDAANSFMPFNSEDIQKREVDFLRRERNLIRREFELTRRDLGLLCTSPTSATIQQAPPLVNINT